MVSSTGSPTTVLHKDEIASILPARANRPLVLVDIAVPRDIAADAEELENVYLYNIDHLEAIVRENKRTGAGPLHVPAIIAKHTERLLARFQPEREIQPGCPIKNFDGVKTEAGRLSLLGFVESATFG